MDQAKAPPLLLFLLSLTIFTFTTPPPFGVAATTPIKALVAPITKDSLTSLYTLTINNHSPFLLYLTGTLLWAPCRPTHFTLPCNSTACSAAASFPPPHCPRVTRTNKHPCTCTASLVNPVTGTCGFADLTLTDLTIATTNGRNPTNPITVHGFVSSCAPPRLLRSLPAGTAGVAGLSRSALALPAQLSSSLSIKTQFAVCLPSTSAAPGVAFFGDKPFYLLPPTSLEVTSILSYTPLLKNPTNPGYYIDLKGIAVNGEAVRFLRRVLEFDSQGNGGVRLSTVTPYTALRSHVYRPFLQAFAKATERIPRVPTVKPFGLCLNSSALGVTRVGYAVPQIDLMLPGGKNWTVFGANSMKQVGKEAACLAFVDGGPKAEQAVVIGGFQMEDNFMLFDVGRSRLGFSSSLFFIRTTCGNFNFTHGS